MKRRPTTDCAECGKPIAGLTFTPKYPKVCDDCYAPRSPLAAAMGHLDDKECRLGTMQPCGGGKRWLPHVGEHKGTHGA